MHPYFLNKTPSFNLLDLLTSDLRHIAGDTYKVFFEKVLTFMLRSYFGLKVDKISENPVFSRLLNFCPIITQSSILLTIPVAFIDKPPAFQIIFHNCAVWVVCGKHGEIM